MYDGGCKELVKNVDVGRKSDKKGRKNEKGRRREGTGYLYPHLRVVIALKMKCCVERGREWKDEVLSKKMKY